MLILHGVVFCVFWDGGIRGGMTEAQLCFQTYPWIISLAKCCRDKEVGEREREGM